MVRLEDLQILNSSLTSSLSRLPDAPGIYLYFTSAGELVYVGKATSLKSRVRSYFVGQRAERSIELMLHEVAQIKWKVTDSVLEAVIWEAIYIKKYQPKYNVLGKDNKSWNYIIISADEYPQVKTLREHELLQKTAGERRRLYRAVFGPYPGLNAKEAMWLLRKLFMFSSCQSAGNRRSSGTRRHSKIGYRRFGRSAIYPLEQLTGKTARPCFYYQMGQCLGVCTGEISPVDYRRRVIRPLTLFLSGQKQSLSRIIERRMARASRDLEFEEAARLRGQLRALVHIQDVALLNDSFFREVELTSRDARQMFTPTRIEGYDISNLGRTGMVGSLVVFNQAGPLKSYYRKFRIRTVSLQSDVDCLAEVLDRRLKHTHDWPLPDLILIDGGAPQVNRAVQILRVHNLDIPVVGIAKGPERKRNDFYFCDWRVLPHPLPASSKSTVAPAEENTRSQPDENRENRYRQLISWVYTHQKLLIQVRDEAHRFALRYQRQLRRLK